MAEQEKATFIGKIVLLPFYCRLLLRRLLLLLQKTGCRHRNAGHATSAAQSHPPDMAIEIGIAYGTEKKRWLEWAAEQFANTSEGKDIKINLIPMGSLEGAQALLAGDQRIDVWSPASAAYKDIFLQDWQVKYGGNPIVAKKRSLCLRWFL